MKTDVFKNEAIKQAEKSSYKQRLGAIVVYKGKIVSFGHNKVLGTGNVRTDGFHAEIEALNNCPAKCRKDSTVFVCRVNKKGELRLAKPCKTCFKVLKKLGVKYVWFSTSNEEWEKMILQ